jgi:predicted permease
MPPAEYGHHSEPKTEECAHDHCRKRWEVQKVSDYHRDAGGKCSNGIKICPEYSRSFVHENITQHSASNSSQHPHNRSHHWIESGGQRFLRTGDGEQSQAGAIEQQQVDVGFRPDHTLTAVYGLPSYQYATQASIDTFDEQVLRNLRHLPGVEAVGITSGLPSTGDYEGPAITIEGYVSPRGAGLNLAVVSLLRGDPIQALGIRLLRGRTFTEADNAGSPLVALVNSRLAQRYWPGQDPIGKRFRRGMQETATPWMTVVGEVDSVKMGSPDERTADQFYQPVDQTAISEGDFASAGEVNADWGNIVLRTHVEPWQMENALRATVHQMDPQLPLYHIQTMEYAIAGSEAPRRFNTILISCFALVAVLLSVLGIYSIIAFSVALREQEMALRMALGCQRSGVLALILTSGVKLAAVGCVFGLLGAVAASRLLRSFLFAVSPFDPVVLTLAAVAMLLLALAASALPARRASRTDPMLALRGE